MLRLLIDLTQRPAVGWTVFALGAGTLAFSVAATAASAL